MCFAAALLAAPSAVGNGRFPRAQRLIESATDPSRLALYGTYGLIVSSDSGATWNHVCEAATGIYTGEDPLLEILPDQKILARTESALIRSGGSWCDWSTVRDGSVRSIQDITRDASAPATIVALIGEFVQGTGFSSLIVRSPDGGTTWSSEAKLPLVSRGLSLDVAPSSSKRVVVSGLDSSSGGRLLVSDDGGGTWLGRVLGATDSNSAPYVAQISKDDPNRIFVRTDAYQAINGVDTAADALLMTTDAGKTWATVIQKSAKLFGFALSPDESTLLVGYGDPVVSATYVEPNDLGVYRADMAAILADPANAATHFEKIFDASVTCLRWTATGLFACTSQSERGFEIGKAPNAAFTIADANPFTPLLVLPKVRPLPCSAGTSAYACYTNPDNGFASVCQVFQTSCDAGSPPPATGAPDSGVVSSSGGGPATSSGGGGGVTGPGNGGAPPNNGGASAGGAGPTAGAPGSGGASGQDTSGAPSASSSSNEKESSSCACRTGFGDTPNGAATFLVALTGIAFVRRRRSVAE